MLAGLGLLASGLPDAAHAQAAGSVLPPGTLPQLRAIVSGNLVVDRSVPGAARPELTITQSTARGIIDWKSFNISSDASVRFIQPDATASTLNRIYSADPSIIQGQLSANGQVLLINQNGILFDRGAQVNVNSLVASTLNMSNERFLAGSLAAGGLATPAFEGGYDDAGQTLAVRPDGQAPGSIVIGGSGPQGAEAARLQAAAGGSILVFAPRIDHRDGLITAPDGQVILAAGHKAYLALSADPTDITLRGFVVEVEAPPDQPVDLSSMIRNAGQVSADRGNVTLAALSVNQAGRVTATTALQANGSIYLKARTKDGVQAGAARFEAGSVTEVTPDPTDKATVPDAQSYADYRGVVQVQGGRIESRGTLRATGGLLALEAADAAAPESARVYLDAGSVTSVAGAWSDVDPAKNVATIRVTSNELKNAPDQKNGVLFGATVSVDLRRGNEILALDGYRAAVERSVAEKAAVGGEMTINSTGAVVQREGALLDVSGGGYRYAGSWVQTSKLLGSDGRVYDIATAPQALSYSGLLDSFQRSSDRWGQTTEYRNPLGRPATYQEASNEGQAAGTLRVGSAAGLVLDGELRGGVTIGANQLNAAPAAGTLYVGTGTQPLSLANLRNPPVNVEYNPEGQRIGNVTWRADGGDTLGAGFRADTPLTEAQRTQVWLGASQVFGAATPTAGGLVETAFGRVEVNSDGRVVVPAGVSIEGGVGASLVLRGPQVDVAGDIRLPAGSLSLLPQLSDSSVLPDPFDGFNAAVRSGAELSVAGSWFNFSGEGGALLGTVLPSSRQGSNGAAGAPAIAGGTLRVGSSAGEFATLLERGAVLDASGGGQLSARGSISGGKGGRITVANSPFGQDSSDWLQAEMRGFSLAAGGELSLSLNEARIEGDAPAGTLPADVTRLDAGLFSEQGFARIGVSSVQGTTLAAGAEVKVEQRNYVVDAAAAQALDTGSELRSVARVERLPDHLRGAASASLSASVGRVVVEAGSRLETDPLGALTLSSTGDGIDVAGRLSAPGGAITLSLAGSDLLTAAPLHLAAGAELDARGTFVASPDDLGRVQGTLVHGGSVTLQARQAGVQLDEGSRIDVSAVSQTVDVTVGGKAPGAAQRTLAGNAGTVTISSQGSTTLKAEIVGSAGADGGAGGSFALEVQRPDRQLQLPDAQRIVVGDGAVPATPVAGVADTAIDVTALARGGFDKLRLASEDRIFFAGDAALDFERGIRLDAPVLELAEGARVRLESSTVSLGQSLGVRFLGESEFGRVWLRDDSAPLPDRVAGTGSGTLRVEAGHVDFFGSLLLEGTLLASIHSEADVRFIGRDTLLDLPDDGIDGNVTRQLGSLQSGGSLEFRASQLYPATRTQFTVASEGDDGYLLVGGNGRAGGDVYSAAGSLTLEAPTLVQAGTVKAPLGEIRLEAGRLLELGEGSLTSVSGEGRTVLYGGTLAGVTWTYIDGAGQAGANPLVLDAVSGQGKQLTLSAPDVQVRPGATVDLSGGGDVLAVEFVPGSGGDADITMAANTYAVLPKSRLSTIPYDSYLQLAAGSRDPGAGFVVGNGRDAAVYDSLEVGAGGALPAGEYVLLPARFALLPDAYLVQLQTGAAYRNMVEGQVERLRNGDLVVAAHRTARGTGVRESQTVGVVVQPGSAVFRASEYTLTTAGFFADAATRTGTGAPASPWDAGRVSVTDVGSLTLAGDFVTGSASYAGAAGRAAEIDLAGSRIAIVDVPGTGAAPAGFLEVGVDTLNALDASVLVGGTRRRTDDGVRVSTLAEEVRVSSSASAPVQLPELIVSARETIDVAAGSVLQAEGELAGRGAESIEAEASGALIRLSVAGQARLDRGSADAARGDVRIGTGAQLQASTSLLVDATRSTASTGTLRAGGPGGEGGSLALSSSRVSVGQTEAVLSGLGGLVLTSADLLAYASLDELTLRGYDAIEAFGSATIGSSSLKQLTLDTPLLAAIAAGAATPELLLTAGEVTLRNSAATSRPAAGGSGRLVIDAATVTAGEGAKATSGFATVEVRGSERVETQGRGDLRAGGALTMTTPVLQARGGSVQTLAAVDETGGASRFLPVDLMAGAAAPAGDGREPEMGGQISLQGSRVNVDTVVQARSGRIAVAGLGGGAEAGVRIGGGARLDAAGQAKDFNGTIVVADAGRVDLSSRDGAVELEAGSTVDVSAAAQGGDAGALRVSAASFEPGGTLLGQAGADARSGSAILDLDRLADFSALNDVLDAGGFAAERALRLHDGNLTVGSGDQVAARRVTLTADAGRIDVFGTVGAGAAGGSAAVALHAAEGLRLAPGARVLAQAGDAGARGGEVRLDTLGGALVFDAGAMIDVRAGDGGPPGSVVFGVGRDAAGAVGPVVLEGSVERHSSAGLAAAAAGEAGDRPARVDVEATRVYALNGVTEVLDTDRIDALAQEHRAFASAALDAPLTTALKDGTGALVDVRLLGATEIQAAGDLLVSANWDLTGTDWLTGDRPGTLTLRAAGSLTLEETLGAPSLPTSGVPPATLNENNNVNHAIRDGDTWSIRLAAGADLGSADPLAVRRDASAGDVLLRGPEAQVRTGTGRIDVAAAGDIRLTDPASAIYTAGRIGAPDTARNGNDRWAVDGGGITLSAGGSISGPEDAGALFVTDWLRRDRLSIAELARLGYPTDWWTYRPRYQQGIGTLAGGDIVVRADGDFRGLSVDLPTSGRTHFAGDEVDQANRRVDVTGGGDLDLEVGGDLASASFLVGRGHAVVRAAGGVGTSGAPVQVYAMGVDGDGGAGEATVRIAAGNGLWLQSVNNPTMMPLNSTTGAAGPSFNPTNPAQATSSNPEAFFSYSANAAVGLTAKSGDIAVAGRLADADAWRSFGSINVGLIGGNVAFTPSLALVAMGGDILGGDALPEAFGAGEAIVTYPSPQGSAVLLAAGSIRDLGLTASDTTPAALVTPFQNVENVRSANQPESWSTGSIVTAPAPGFSPGRIVERGDGENPFGVAARDAALPAYPFELQALEGSILYDGGYKLSLPGVSRIRAGQDLVNIQLTLTHLEPGDLSEVRATNGDLRQPGRLTGGNQFVAALEVRGPGQLLVQAGGDIDLGTSNAVLNGIRIGGIAATGNNANADLRSQESARISLFAGVRGDIDLARLDGDDGIYAQVITLNGLSSEILDLYALLNTESDAARVQEVASIADLAARDSAYARFVELDTKAPQALSSYQATLRDGRLPLGATPETALAETLYAFLNADSDTARIRSAGSLQSYLDSLAGQPGASAGTMRLGEQELDIAAALALDAKYPVLFRDYALRRGSGALPTKVTPIAFGYALDGVVGGIVGDESALAEGSIRSFLTSIQSYGGSDIDLWAPGGNITVGLTTPSQDATIGVLTNAGGAVRSVLSGNFDINQGKVITAQGGDILIYSSQGSIDAGRGAKTSIATPPPLREPILDSQGNQIGVRVTISAAATGSGIQTLTSDPDGLGPLQPPRPGNVYLFAPAGTIDAGEAGIRSSGNVILNAQAVLNAADIRASGSSQGVPQLQVGSLASALASSNTSTTAGTAAAEEAASAAQERAREAAAAAAATPKPRILTVEFLGFGSGNCDEDDKECFAK